MKQTTARRIVRKNRKRQISGGVVLLIVLVWSVLYAQHRPSFPPDFARAATIGKGCSTAFVLDNDCDGYGVGPGLQRDADDEDPDVNTTASVFAKYGSIAAFLDHLGYNHKHIYYLSPDGNDSTCSANDETRPCATLKTGVMPKIVPGDAILVRAGTYHEVMTLSKSGNTSAWCTFMAYPGEAAVLDTVDSSRAWIINHVNQQYWHIHGFIITDSKSGILPGYPYGIYGGYLGTLTIRDIDMSNAGTGIMEQYGISGLVIEHNVIYNSKVEHDIYLGNRDNGNGTYAPVTGLVVRGNILGYSMLTNLHMNGQFASPVVENNIVHSAQTGITIQNGTTNGLFQNNVIFNHSQQSIVMGCYWGNNTIFGHPQNGNQFLNNTMWQGNLSYVDGKPVSGADGYRLYDGSTPAQGYACDMSGTVIVNNIIQTWNGPSILFLNQHVDWLAGAVIHNNLFYHPATSGDCTFRWGAGPSYAPKMELGDGNTYYSLPAFEALYQTSISGNILADPLFIRAKDHDWSDVGPFDFSLQPGSPAIHAGSPVTAPSLDIRGTTRANPPNIGAYEDLSNVRKTPRKK